MVVYSGLTVFAFIGQMTLTIVLLKFFGYEIYNVVFSALFSCFVPLVIVLGIIIKQVGFSLPTFSKMPEYLRCSSPLTPNSLILLIILKRYENIKNNKKGVY